MTWIPIAITSAAPTLPPSPWSSMATTSAPTAGRRRSSSASCSTSSATSCATSGGTYRSTMSIRTLRWPPRRRTRKSSDWTSNDSRMSCAAASTPTECPTTWRARTPAASRARPASSSTAGATRGPTTAHRRGANRPRGRAPQGEGGTPGSVRSGRRASRASTRGLSSTRPRRRRPVSRGSSSARRTSVA